MRYVALIRLREGGRVYDFDTGGLQLVPGDRCIVQTDRGLEYGEVVSETMVNPPCEPPEKGRRVVRKATPEDEEVARTRREEEQRALGICRRKIAEHGLPMKLVDAERSFDGTRTTFYFTAEGRVDFRELVKDLARELRTRIELRQIGVRDEAKMLGGMGPCGLPCCCITFLHRFEPVSIRMAREQKLSLNPTKISGLCGRLMCCLRYENEVYQKFNRAHPREGATVDTPHGRGRIRSISVPKERARVELEEGRIVEIPVSDIGKKPEEAAAERLSKAAEGKPSGNEDKAARPRAKAARPSAEQAEARTRNNAASGAKGQTRPRKRRRRRKPGKRRE